MAPITGTTQAQAQVEMRTQVRVDWLDLAHRILDIFEEKQAEDIVLLDMRPVTIITDYFLIATATSERQSRAIVDEVAQQIKKALDVRPLGIYGVPESGWMIMDYGGVVVHLFAPEKRAYYDLEGLWSEAPVVVRVP